MIQLKELISSLHLRGGYFSWPSTQTVEVNMLFEASEGIESVRWRYSQKTNPEKDVVWFRGTETTIKQALEKLIEEQYTVFPERLRKEWQQVEEEELNEILYETLFREIAEQSGTFLQKILTVEKCHAISTGGSVLLTTKLSTPVQSLNFKIELGVFGSEFIPETKTARLDIEILEMIEKQLEDKKIRFQLVHPSAIRRKGRPKNFTLSLLVLHLINHYQHSREGKIKMMFDSKLKQELKWKEKQLKKFLY